MNDLMKILLIGAGCAFYKSVAHVGEAIEYMGKDGNRGVILISNNDEPKRIDADNVHIIINSCYDYDELMLYSAINGCKDDEYVFIILEEKYSIPLINKLNIVLTAERSVFNWSAPTRGTPITE